MKLPLETLDGLPEGLKSAITEADGVKTLDLSKLMATEDLTGLKGALSKERANNAAWAALGENPDAVKASMQELRDAKPKGRSDDEHKQILDQMTADFDAKLSGRDEIIGTMRKSNTSAELKAELAKAGVLPEGMDLLANFALSRVSYAEDGALRVSTMDGKPMIGTGADHGATLSDLAKELAGSVPQLVRDAGAGGGGKQPGSSGGTPKTTITRTAFDSMDQGARSTFAKEGGKVVDG